LRAEHQCHIWCCDLKKKGNTLPTTPTLIRALIALSLLFAATAFVGCARLETRGDDASPYEPAEAVTGSMIARKDRRPQPVSAEDAAATQDALRQSIRNAGNAKGAGGGAP
jgi:hypothetical protein